MYIPANVIRKWHEKNIGRESQNKFGMTFFVRDDFLGTETRLARRFLKDS